MHLRVGLLAGEQPVVAHQVGGEGFRDAAPVALQRGVDDPAQAEVAQADFLQLLAGGIHRDDLPGIERVALFAQDVEAGVGDLPGVIAHYLAAEGHQLIFLKHPRKGVGLLEPYPFQHPAAVLDTHQQAPLAAAHHPLGDHRADHRHFFIGQNIADPAHRAAVEVAPGAIFQQIPQGGDPGLVEHLGAAGANPLEILHGDVQRVLIHWAVS